MKRHLNVHAGEVLREEFLFPLNITARELAKRAKLPQRLLNQIPNEEGRITAEADLCLCTFFSLRPGYWLRLQLAHELRDAVQQVGAKIKATVRPLGKRG